MRRIPRRSAGFTIIEYIFAMTIMGAMFAFASQVFFSNQQHIAGLTSAGEEQANLRIVLARMAKILKNSRVLIPQASGESCPPATPAETVSNQTPTGTFSFCNPDNNNQISGSLGTTGATDPLFGVQKSWKGSWTSYTDTVTYHGVIPFIKMRIGAAGINTNGDAIFNYSSATEGMLCIYYFNRWTRELHYQEYPISSTTPPWVINPNYRFDVVTLGGWKGRRHPTPYDATGKYGDNPNGELSDFQVELGVNPAAPSNWPADYPYAYTPTPGFVNRVTMHMSYMLHSARTSTQNATDAGGKGTLGNRQIIRLTNTVHIPNAD